MFSLTKYSDMEIIKLAKDLSKHKRLSNMICLNGSSHPELGVRISGLLGIPIVDCVVENFSNTEIRVEIRENVRNKDVFLIQTGSFSNYDCRSVNDNLMETMIMIDACKRSAVKSITLIMPCYPYARQDKKDEARAPISAKLVANMLTMAGIDRLIVMDLHASQIQGFFDIPVDNIYSIILLKQYLDKTMFKGLSLGLKYFKRFIYTRGIKSLQRLVKVIEILGEKNTVERILMNVQKYITDFQAANKAKVKSILVKRFDTINRKYIYKKSHLFFQRRKI